jgi:CHAT domain-containing protein
LALAGLAQGEHDQAQALTLEGQQWFERGDAQAALESWKQAEGLYHQVGDEVGAIGSQVNQAKALQNLGFYRRAQLLLEQVVPLVQSRPDSGLKANALLTYGNLLRLMDSLEASQRYLQASLAIARKVRSPVEIQAAQLHLGNTALAQRRFVAALKLFQQAAATPGPLQLTAKLRQLRLLRQLDESSPVSQRWRAETAALLPGITARLTQLPITQTTVYAHIELADLIGADAPLRAAELLATAMRQAHLLGDRRAASYATGRLGGLYEQTQQWETAQRLTQAALQLAQTVNVSEILYQWQWQQGRIAQAQGDRASAVAAYRAAIATLQGLRSDLVAITPDVQFSFRDQVEPVYRELVDLLLQPGATQADLSTAREVMESLQVAELHSFFREACLNPIPRSIESVDRTAAVLYPIVLPDRVEVILSLPGQPLRQYTTPQSQASVQAAIQRLLTSLRRSSFAPERLAAAQPLYQWLVQPAEAALAQAGVQTLVFVLDEPLRRVPMAALHTGSHYLIEQYQIALMPGLQLFSPRRLPPSEIRVLVGGLTQAVAGLTALPGVQQETEYLRQQFGATVLLNQAFTVAALTAEMNAAPYTVLHLATHGQFSSQTAETYIQTWNNRLTIPLLRALLHEREASNAAIELLVLSACETAEGDRQATLGMAGIAVRSGARSTLATLWTVNDFSTAQFMSEFYQALAQPDQTRAQAIRQAQLALIRSSEYNHPFYWSPFILIGNWL